ncbi:hypothetical protein ASG25_00510 [Rhizobium sp. Leaf384]|uniref:SPOR domain-containing protein n=1 Tax=unclassified Rhizobium TaxID=2613769 RepID=UPI000713850C|nr:MULTISPECIES: SPOR domain-containing protein [unclassified Rhizobium]KQS74427.1 hypothetical protein ASG58_15705 [Rhizobium sp. Leaf383]KQS80165.1 hypothetical protein ASG25_00510 [Rhizobium sp. Leaf384]
MADKQLARSADVDPNSFPDEDPLSELARIVGYDNRPALQQLQELERHREAVRYDPIVDLEEELMREFEAYDTPVVPDVATPEPVVHMPPVVQMPPVVEPVAVQPPVRAPQPVQPQPRPVEPTFEMQPEPVAHHNSEPGYSAVRRSEPAIDLGDELEMSLGSSPQPVVAPPMPVEPVRQPVRPHVDALLQTVEQFAVPHAPARPAVAAEAARKNNFPFTPNFSRATPVALSSGANRTFATPLPPAPVVAPAAPVLPAAAPTMAVAPSKVEPVMQAQAPVAAAAVVAAPIAAPFVQPAPAVAAEPEPDFNFDDFEIDLSDIDIELDMAADEVAPIEEPVEAFTEAELPFDPSMIAEADYGVTATGDIDVPQLPVIEEQNLQLDAGDYDLDIDAEMAQIFSAGRQESERGNSDVATAVAAGVAGAAAPARSSHEEFADFERAMEEDFRRSISQRQEVIGQGDRSYEPAHGNDNDVRPRSKLFLLAGAAAIVLIAGGVGAYTMMGSVGATFASSEPQIILADKAPTKMVPLEKGGKTVPNQDKAVYDRVAGAQEEAPQQGTLVSSTEEPIDVVQRTLTPESLPLEGANGLDGMPADDEGADRLMPEDGDAQATAAAEDAVPAVAPRKVRTMIVRPDGTLVAREETAPEEAPVVAAAAPTGKTVKAGTPTANTAALATPAQDEVGALAAAADATVSNVSAQTAKAQPLPEARPVTKPVETAKATRKPVDTFATSTTPASAAASGAASAPADTSPVQTASIAPGSYVVQVASLPSEAEAQKSYKSLSGKFGSVIAGRGVDIKKADIAGKGTYYRVRIPAGSRDEANALCSRLKSAGGSCLVTR